MLYWLPYLDYTLSMGAITLLHSASKERKVKRMDIMMKSVGFLDAVSKLGTGLLSEALFEICETFVCHLYGRAKMANMNVTSLVIFQQTDGPNNMDDPLDSIQLNTTMC